MPSPSADLHDLWKSGLPLGVSCNNCLHRSLIEPGRLGAREGSTRCIDTFHFHCTKCRQRAFTAHVFRARREVRRFMAEYR